MPNQAYVEYKPTAKGTHSMRQNPLAVTVWLLICCGMIFVMALLGAITRLTESGLSITEWNPVMGILPPLNAAAWQQAFAGYQEIPQYQLLHRGMTLEAFKEIYFWEWLHRLWGRLIGIAFAVFAAGCSAFMRAGREIVSVAMLFSMLRAENCSVIVQPFC